jgi:hypothetical protein
MPDPRRKISSGQNNVCREPEEGFLREGIGVEAADMGIRGIKGKRVLERAFS